MLASYHTMSNTATTVTTSTTVMATMSKIYAQKCDPIS